VLSLEELLQDQRFVDFEARDRNRDDLLPTLRERFAQHDTAHWVDRLTSAGVPVGRVNSVKQAFADEQVRSREALIAYNHPRLGEVRQPASALRIQGHTPAYGPGPSRGEATAQLLADLCGYDEARIDSARRQGAFGPPSETATPAVRQAPRGGE
jgi:crotonobetainyl-CoA:carnitine CoA-transferase CaiB-like acyl-CoA transferase